MRYIYTIKSPKLVNYEVYYNKEKATNRFTELRLQEIPVVFAVDIDEDFEGILEGEYDFNNDYNSEEE